MASSNKHQGDSSNYVDISSKTQLVKVYKKKGRVIRIIAIVLSVLMIISGSGLIYYYSVLDRLNFKPIETTAKSSGNTSTAETEPSDDINTTISDGDLLSNSKVLNIMLFGEDNHKAGSTGRSDSMIMLSIDNLSKSIKLTSFQRDTYVYIPGNDYNKINASYTFGGAALAIKTIEANFGIKVDRYAVVDFSSFTDIIDTLGGLTIYIDEDEAAYINFQMYKNKQTTNRHLLKEKSGKVTLNGKQALWYARDRGYEGIQGGDDWDRTSRQRKVIETIFSSMKKASLTQIIDIVSKVGPLVTTNLKKDEITGLVTRALTYLSYDVKKYSVPQNNLWSYYDDDYVGSCIQIDDMEKCRNKFAKFIFGKAISSDTSSKKSN